MSLSQKIKLQICELHLLNHPFYQSWNHGELRPETLQEYARQYYHHVAAFPRYISSTHSKCISHEDRKVLLENLNDEEGLHGTPHPELWIRFAEGLGVHRDDLLSTPPKEAIQKVIQTFRTSSESSYAEGLASFYTYEYQVPEIADTKIKGLKEHYRVNDDRSLSFFNVHKEADVYHREACEKIIDKLPESSTDVALKASLKSAQALWDFLSEMNEYQHAC